MTTAIAASQTALLAAAARAAHCLVDPGPHLLRDDAARRLCEAISPSPLEYQLQHPGVPILASARFSAAVRARYADAAVAELGIDQVVMVGAGLDTLSSRIAPSARPRVWLMDRAGVLAWRSGLFEAAGLADAGRHVAVDLNEGIDLGALRAAGLDLAARVAVIWLGVSMYLSASACRQVFADLAALPQGSALVFDYLLEPGRRDEAGTAYATGVAQMAAKAGEPWLCSTTPEVMSGWLVEGGWEVGDDRDEADAVPAGFWDAQTHLQPMTLVRLVTARRRPASSGGAAATVEV